MAYRLVTLNEVENRPTQVSAALEAVYSALLIQERKNPGGQSVAFFDEVTGTYRISSIVRGDQGYPLRDVTHPVPSAKR